MSISGSGRGIAGAALVALLAGAPWLATAVRADTLGVTCSDGQSGETMRFAYDGAESGTLRITGDFGEASLPATSREATNTLDGQQMAIRAIRADGPAEIRMLDQGALEDCIVKRRIPGQPADKDVDFMSAMACQPELPLAETPITVGVDVEFALIDGQLAELVMHRTYPGVNEVTGDKLQLTTMAFGSFQCEAGD